MPFCFGQARREIVHSVFPFATPLYQFDTGVTATQGKRDRAFEIAWRSGEVRHRCCF